MQTRQRVSTSLPINLVSFVQKTAKKKGKPLNYVFEQALGIFKRILEEEELKNAYLKDNSDDFNDLILVSYYNDFIKNAD